MRRSYPTPLSEPFAATSSGMRRDWATAASRGRGFADEDAWAATYTGLSSFLLLACARFATSRWRGGHCLCFERV